MCVRSLLDLNHPSRCLTARGMANVTWGLMYEYLCTKFMMTLCRHLMGSLSTLMNMRGSALGGNREVSACVLRMCVRARVCVCVCVCVCV